MRKSMLGLNQKHNYIFSGIYKGDCQWGYNVVRDVKIYDANTNEYKGKVEHLLIEKKKFKKYNEILHFNSKIRFTGNIYNYRRMDGSTDFGVKVRKIKAINGEKVLDIVKK